MINNLKSIPADAGIFVPDHQKPWMSLAQDSYRVSQDWFVSNHQKRIETALLNFNLEHARGSKYRSELYAKKSKLFRPKTRSIIRRLESAATLAFFSTQDVVSCRPVNESDPDQVDAAEIYNYLLNWRLNHKDMRFFKIMLGAVQDATVTGAVISRQDWAYEKKLREYEMVYDGARGEIVEVVQDIQVIKDQPTISLIPVELMRWSPAADWLDPIGTSPYLIELVPTYVDEIVDRMDAGEYVPINEALIAASQENDIDAIRAAREGDSRGIDRYRRKNSVKGHDIAWVHRNIQRVDGEDVVYDTLGNHVMLHDRPIPLTDLYKHGERPYVMGCSIVESHKGMPMSIATMVRDMSAEITDLANLRMDNLRLAMNKRWLTRRGASVDHNALLRNTAGGYVSVGDVNNDVKELTFQDVTSNSFAEQDRLSLETDELGGVFSQSTVGASRKLNETVGGMNLLSADSSELKEFVIRTISETWVEPAVRQIALLEGFYESDRAVLENVATRAGLPVERALEVLREPIWVNTQVGYNSTNPIRRIERLSMGMTTVANLLPNAMTKADPKAITTEIFGALGYRTGERFFPGLYQDQDISPEMQALIAENEQLRAMLADRQMENQTKIQVAQIAAEAKQFGDQIKAQTQLQIAAFEGDQKGQIEAMKARLAELDKMIAAETTQIKRDELVLQREALSHSIVDADRRFRLEVEKASAGKKPDTGEPAGPMDLAGNDKAGTLARNDYGLVPQNIG